MGVYNIMSTKDYICKFTHTDKSKKMKCILRTLFYQFILLFIGGSIGFICNAEYVGWKLPIVTNSFYNTFYPIDFEDPGVLQWLYGNGRLKIFGTIVRHKDLEVIEEAMLAEEWYWVKFSYTDENGNTRIDIKNVRIRWKPWEYYFDEEGLFFALVLICFMASTIVSPTTEIFLLEIPSFSKLFFEFFVGQKLCSARCERPLRLNSSGNGERRLFVLNPAST